MGAAGEPWVGVALKWVDLRPGIDPLTGEVTTDPRSSGCSAADRAALEWALRLAEAWGGKVLAATAGPPEAKAALELALAAGAHRAVRAALPRQSPSAAVARSLAPALSGCSAVVCGDRSLDGGSGSVPAFLATELGAAQALGLVGLQPEGMLPAGGPRAVVAERRLDGGRRERLRVVPPAVLSVEGATAALRRATLPAVMAARSAPVEVLPGRASPLPPLAPTRTGPFRPRPKALAGPDPGLAPWQRMAALVEGPGQRRQGSVDPVVASPGEGARLIVEALRRWGYLKEGEGER
jgi:electron transfer flavoprotein beta subunit